jgi:hypothetical protein
MLFHCDIHDLGIPELNGLADRDFTQVAQILGERGGRLRETEFGRNLDATFFLRQRQ